MPQVKVVCLDLEQQRAGAEDTVARLRALGTEACFVPTDMTQRAQIAAAVRAAVAAFGALHISVAVVGGGPAGARAPFLEHTEEAYDRIVAGY